MKKYITHLRESILTKCNPIVLRPVYRLLIIIIALASGSPLWSSPPPQSNAVEIISIVPLEVGSSHLRITWEGAVPPYKLQAQDSVGGAWRDASFHIYGHSFVVSNSLPGSFYRVRTIPDRTPPTAIKNFGPRQADCDRVRFTWDPGTCKDALCADNAGGSGMRGYRIYRNGAFLMEIPFPASLAWDTTVSGSTLYSYWATTVDMAGNESAPSDTRTVRTASCDPPPKRDVTLAWDANPEPDVTGYVLRYGRSSGNYNQTLDAGNATTNTVPELISGTTYYFVVAAYNADGLEGDNSNEVVYLVP